MRAHSLLHRAGHSQLVTTLPPHARPHLLCLAGATSGNFFVQIRHTFSYSGCYEQDPGQWRVDRSPGPHHDLHPNEHVSIQLQRTFLRLELTCEVINQIGLQSEEALIQIWILLTVRDKTR